MMSKKNILILIIASFFIVLFFLRHYFSIFYFQNDINKTAINIETSNKLNKDLYICFDKNCDKMSYENNIYTYKLNQQNPLFYKIEFKNIEIITNDENFLNETISVSVFSENNFSYILPDKLNKNNIEFNNQNSFLYKIPFKIKKKTILQKASIYFESIFYNWYFYILSYILIIFYISKYHFKLNLNSKIPLIFLIVILGFLLRLSHINFIPLWNDELYTVYHIFDTTLNLKRTVLDPGNPPIFFMISNLWLYKFNFSTAAIRFLPLILGLIQIISIYYILNKILNKKIALISAFISSINIFIILESNEIRSYILSMSLILWQAYFFYKLYKNFTYKNWLLYLLFSILLVNTHYYTFLYAISGTILGLFLFKNNKIKFLLANIIAFLTFIPYFQTTMLFNSFEKNFNTWLEKPSLDVIYNHIIFYFGNMIFFIITVIFSIWAYKKHLKSTKEGKIFLYNIYSISFVFILAYVISILIKPILFERYFCIFLPYLIINTAILLNINYKISFLPLIIFLFSINIPKYENFNLFSNIDTFSKYSSADYKNQTKETYFIIPDSKSYLKKYPDLPKERVIISNTGSREDIDLLKEYKKQLPKNKEIILYVPEICINSKIKYSKSKNIKKINTSILPMYKIYLE